eukprot:5800045-Prorocentrum_lima.AAC.1
MEREAWEETTLMDKQQESKTNFDKQSIIHQRGWWYCYKQHQTYNIGGRGGPGRWKEKTNPT